MGISTLLIANRGEIACRIARTARTLGIRPEGVHSAADAGALHVRQIGRSRLIGGGPAGESYLRIEAVMEAAMAARADAVHPGYGFLAENPAFARAVEAAGMIFVGPAAETLERFADKAAAKTVARAAGVPLLDGSQEALSDPKAIARAARKMGFPVLLKAAGGGGGRGQRLVTDPATLGEDIAAALREAQGAFGSGALLLERFLPEARHIEVQIAGDGEGRVLHLWERDCTLQRRHQKVIEEAPAPDLPAALRARLLQDAVRLGQAAAYRGLGTVEFLVAEGQHFFLEINPRLQVEHPVTEAVTGLDLVELQLRIAAGEGLRLAQDDVPCAGHALEARLYAEDPAAGFAPSTGRVSALVLPDGIRCDSGVEAGDEVTPYYDPMIAKLIVHASCREEALRRLDDALERTLVAGLVTNRTLLINLLRAPEVAKTKVYTRWIDARLDSLTTIAESETDRWAGAVAAALWVMRGRAERSPDTWRNREVFSGWQLGVGAGSPVIGQPVELMTGENGASIVWQLQPFGPDGVVRLSAPETGEVFVFGLRPLTGVGNWLASRAGEEVVVQARVGEAGVELAMAGKRFVFSACPLTEAVADASASEADMTAPLTGLVVNVAVAEGSLVAPGDTVAVMESMKMEIAIRATQAGRVSGIAVTEGAMVDRGQRVATIIPDEGSEV